MGSKINMRMLWMGLLGSITVLPVLILPNLVGSVVDEFGFTETQASTAASLNFIAGAIIALVMAFNIRRLNLQKVAVFSLFLAAMSDFLSGYTGDNVYLFMAMRALAGFGQGAAYTAVMSSIARTNDPDRGYGMLMTMQFALSAIGLYLIPLILPLVGIKGMFVGLTVMDIIGVFMALKLISSKRGLDSHVHDENDLSQVEWKVIFSGAAIMVILGLCFLEAAMTAQFSFTERVATQRLEMAPESVGSILAIASLLGVPGGFGCVLLGTRFGRAIPLFIGLTASVVGVVLLTMAQGPVLYSISAYILGFTWAFTLPYYQAAQAALDPHGSVVAAGSFSGTMGNAAGPGLAGLAVLFGGYDAVLLMAGTMLMVSIFCIPNLIFKIRKFESSANAIV
ncbi:MFS transporter [Colwelliaceae bacterium 6471]